MQLILGLALVFCVYWLIVKLQKLPAERRRAGIRNALVGLIIGILLLLVITGRVHILAAIGAALLWLLARLPAMIKYYLWLKQVRAQQAPPPKGDDPATPQPSSSAMAEAEALDVLGLTPEATEQDIIDSHRTLMQKMHPDRGGSNWLAARINAAKDVLLKRHR